MFVTQAAVSMAGVNLAHALKERGIAVGLIHPGGLLSVFALVPFRSTEVNLLRARVKQCKHVAGRAVRCD